MNGILIYQFAGLSGPTIPPLLNSWGSPLALLVALWLMMSVRDQGMKNYPRPRESEIKILLSLPNFYFPNEAHETGQIYQGGFGDMPPHENFEIFNAKSCILSITGRVLLFENKSIFLSLFFLVYNQFEI